MVARVALLTAFLTWAPLAAPAAAQDGPTAPLVAELVDLMTKQQLDAAAVQLDADRFAAVLYIPGVQILAVSAQYAAPALLTEKIATRAYRDVYLDLASASVPESKVFIEDMNADGIKPDRRGDDAFDLYTKGVGQSFVFDGEYRSRNVQEAAYRQAYADAETAYRQMLQALIAELKKVS